MPQDNLLRMQCTVCKRYNYFTRRNKKTVKGKLEMKKYCKWDRKHTIHKEVKLP